MLRNYLNSLEKVLDELKPIAQRAARNNTIVVLVSNFGQSSLLMNFVCSSKARGLDIGNVLVFATDKETLEICEGLGLNVYYDEANFNSLPKGAAKAYGGKMFQAMMWAKVVSVQLVSMLGYDILFQDVDVIWIRNPLEYFFTKSALNEFDILFQDDGARSIRFLPYSANSGFYFVRNNDKTRYLLTTLLHTSDLILSTHSHQSALISLLSEHSSLYSLRVKTLPGYEFASGKEYHRDDKFMRDFINNKTFPWTFHMSWTENSNNKFLYFRQMGMWYVKNFCGSDNLQKAIYSKTLSETKCCANKPIISCHYKDKASIIRCDQSPNIDSWRKPFWRQ